MSQNKYRTRRQEPVVLYCEKEENLLPGQRYGPIIRDVYIIECCTGGYGSVIINDREFPVESGDCYVLLPGDTVTHTAALKDPRRGYWCALDGLELGRHLKKAGISAEAPFAPKDAFDELCSWIQKMVAEWGSGDGGESLRETACIYGFLGVLLRYRSQNGGDDWIERALGLIEARFHEPLSVDEIAREIGLERSYFSVLFKEKTGLSPHRYLISLRISKACALMDGEHCSVADAAAAVGLDPRNFARLLKKETGKTPLEYKRNNA